MQISRTPINAYIPAGTRQQPEPVRLTGVQEIKRDRGDEPQQPPGQATQQERQPHSLPPQEIAKTVQKIRAGQHIPADQNKFDAAIDMRIQRAIGAYTEELYQPVQEQLSLLAGIDLYV